MPTHYSTINGIRIAFETFGEGYPLLMLHGFPRTRRTWEKLIPLLSHRFAIITPDRRGYGDSDRPVETTTYDNATMASDALGLVNHLGVDNFIVLGHDKGLPTARRLAVDHPDRVKAAILLDGLPDGVNIERPIDNNGRSWYLSFFRQRGVAEQLIGQNPSLFFSLFLDRNPHLTPEEHAYYVAMFSRRGSVEAILADYRAGMEADREYWNEQSSSTTKIDVPILALWGGRGPTANASVVDAWEHVANNVRGKRIEDSAHYVQEEQPNVLAQEVLKFADELNIP